MKYSGSAILQPARSRNRTCLAVNPDRSGGSSLDINKVLEELRQEREQVEEAILSIERLALGGAKRRGRPPAWMAVAKAAEPKAKRGRPAGSKNKNAEAKPATA